MTCFDQSNDQIRTDSKKKEGQNLIFQGSHGRRNFVKNLGFLYILDAGRV